MSSTAGPTAGAEDEREEAADSHSHAVGADVSNQYIYASVASTAEHGDNVQSDTQAGQDTGEDRDDDVANDVPDQFDPATTPFVMGVGVRGVVTVRGGSFLALVRGCVLGGAMHVVAVLPVAAAAAAELLPELLHLLLDTEQGIVRSIINGVGSRPNLDAANDDVA